MSRTLFFYNVSPDILCDNIYLYLRNVGKLFCSVIYFCLIFLVITFQLLVQLLLSLRFWKTMAWLLRRVYSSSHFYSLIFFWMLLRTSSRTGLCWYLFIFLFLVLWTEILTSTVGTTDGNKGRTVRKAKVHFLNSSGAFFKPCLCFLKLSYQLCLFS